MDNCIFCKIIARQLPSTIVYENDKVMAFNDIEPAAPIHVIIVPKQHIANVNELTAETVSLIGDIHLAAKEIASKLGIADRGYRLVNNCGPDSGQTVFHLHYHLLGGIEMGKDIL